MRNRYERLDFTASGKRR